MEICRFMVWQLKVKQWEKRSYSKRFEGYTLRDWCNIRLEAGKIIQRLQVNGCLIAMVTDVLDQLIKDEQGMFRLLSVQYKQEQKMHYTQMQDAAKSTTSIWNPLIRVSSVTRIFAPTWRITQMISMKSSSFLRTTLTTTRIWKWLRETSERESWTIIFRLRLWQIIKLK